MSSLNEPKTRIIYQEAPRDYRTEVPNIVFAMKEAGLISNSDFLLYCTYRQIAGEHGACWCGTRKLAIKSGLSTPSITKSKKVLSQPFEVLGGKSLIDITPCDRKKEEADTITIIDIWRENHEFFKNKPTCVKRRHGGVQKEDTRVCKKTTQNNEPTKKEPNKERSIRDCGNVHNSTAPPNSFVPPSASAAQGSIPSRREDYLATEDPHLLEYLALESEYSRYFKQKTMLKWVQKFGAYHVIKTIKYYLEVKDKQKEPIRNPEAWMETAFKNSFAEQHETVEKNKKFAENMKKTYHLRNLKMNKRYCQDTITGKEFYFTLPSETFEDNIKKLAKPQNYE